MLSESFKFICIYSHNNGMKKHFYSFFFLQLVIKKGTIQTGKTPDYM